LLLTIVLSFLPSLYFGVRENWSLLRQWFNQEYLTQTGEEEIWFPSQSLRGVMMRYLTTIDYSALPDSNYRKVNLVDWDRKTVRTLWFVTVGTIYTVFLGLVYRRTGKERWIEAALAFCLVALLEPFTQKYAL